MKAECTAIDAGLQIIGKVGVAFAKILSKDRPAIHEPDDRPPQFELFSRDLLRALL
jgi:hypothetical protein